MVNNHNGMKKSTKIYLWLWVGVIVSSVILAGGSRVELFSPHHRLAQDPENVERITEVNLPDAIIVDSWNNLDRGASCWDCFEHRSTFEEKLSNDCVSQLETLCQTDTIYWHKNDTIGCYEYLDDAWSRGGMYCIRCTIYEDYSYVEYYIDETEGLGIVILGMLVVILVAIVLIVWGIVMFVKIIVCKYNKQQTLFDNDCD